MLATETAEKANRAKSEFISGMSHELRTPLNAILGFGQLLADETIVLPEQKKLEYPKHILRAGAHPQSLINEILDLARIESANLMLSMEPVALVEVLEECRKMIEPSAEQRGIRMLFPESPCVSVMADRTRLRQILLNLLSNAIKYNRESGTGDGARHIGSLAMGFFGYVTKPLNVQRLNETIDAALLHASVAASATRPAAA